MKNLLSEPVRTHHLNPIPPMSSIIGYALSLLRRLQCRWIRLRHPLLHFAINHHLSRRLRSISTWNFHRLSGSWSTHNNAEPTVLSKTQPSFLSSRAHSTLRAFLDDADSMSRSRGLRGGEQEAEKCWRALAWNFGILSLLARRQQRVARELKCCPIVAINEPRLDICAISWIPQKPPIINHAINSALLKIRCFPKGEI